MCRDTPISQRDNFGPGGTKLTTFKISSYRKRPPSKWEDVHSVVGSQIDRDGFHKWPFTPSLPIDVKSFTFGKQHANRPSRHDYFELVYVHSGRAAYEVSGREFNVQPEDLIVINGSLPHRLSKVLESPLNAMVLYFLPDVLRSASSAAEFVQFLMPFLLQGSMFPPLIPAASGISEDVLELMSRIENTIPAAQDRARLEVQTYLQMILVMLIDFYRNDLAIEDAFDRIQATFDRFRPLFEYVERRFNETISLAKATALVGISKPHFMRSFKRLTGQSFDTYLNHYRIAKAQLLLSQTDLPISNVGQEVGFSDQSYFGLVFRKLVQLTPREYRKGMTALRGQSIMEFHRPLHIKSLE